MAQAAGAAKETIVDSATSLGSAFAATTEGTYDAAKQGYQAARGGVRRAYRGLSRSGCRAGRSARRGYSSGLHQINDAYDSASHKLHTAHREYPLGVGLGFLALGALAGLAIPRTRQEDELMGETSEQLRDQLKQSSEHVVEQALDRGQEVVHETMETLKKSAEAHDLTGEKLGEKVRNVAQKESENLADSIHKQGLEPKQLASGVKAVARETTEKAKQEVKQEAKSSKQTER